MTNPTEINGTCHMSEVIHIPVPRIEVLLIILSIPAGLLTEQMEINVNEDVRTRSQRQQSASVYRKKTLVIERLESLVGNRLYVRTINSEAALQAVFENELIFITSLYKVAKELHYHFTKEEAGGLGDGAHHQPLLLLGNTRSGTALVLMSLYTTLTQMTCQKSATDVPRLVIIWD